MRRVISLIFAVLFLSASVLAFADSPYTIPQGADGVWRIPKLHVVVPVYSGRNGQEIVDAEYSAHIRQIGIGREIADHAGSENRMGVKVWYMQDVRLGYKAYFELPDRTEEYECYMLCIVDFNTWGLTINGKLLVPYSSTDILCRSCVDETARQNYVALFRKVIE